MAFFGKLRSQGHYGAGTRILQLLSQGKTTSSMTTDLDSAVKHLRKAVELNPGFVEAHHNLGNVFIMGAEYNQSNYDMFPSAREPDALRYIEEAYSDALDALEKAVSLKHHFPEAHNNRGKALIGLERYEDALQAFDIAIEQSPGYTKAIENREILRTSSFFTTTVTPKPTPTPAPDAYSHMDKGNDYYNDGKYQLAIDEYTTAIRLNPSYTNAYRIRGDAYRELGQFERAIQDFDKAIQLDPNDDGAYNMRGHSYYFLGQYQRAIVDFSQSIQLAPGYAEYYSYRGNAYGDLGQYSQQAADEAKACSLDSKYC